MLSRMFLGGFPPKPDDDGLSYHHTPRTVTFEGWVFIDRDGRLFQYILNYLRDGVELVIPEERRDQLGLQQEARFYAMDKLYDKLAYALAESQPTIARCTIPVLMSEVR